MLQKLGRSMPSFWHGRRWQHYFLPLSLYPVQPCFRRWLVYSSTLSESLDAVMSSKQQAFKIVLLSRLTPVPFGIQNAIFAVNCSLSTSRYSIGMMYYVLRVNYVLIPLGRLRNGKPVRLDEWKILSVLVKISQCKGQLRKTTFLTAFNSLDPSPLS